MQDLQESFVGLLEQGGLGGAESIHEICEELGINVSDLNYDADRRYGLYETDLCRLFIFRFDTLIHENRLEDLLSEITGKTINQQDANLSESRWYKDKYSEFRTSMRIPEDTIRKVYEARREIIDLLYRNEYESLLSRALDKYS